MSTYRSFRDFEVYQKSRALALVIYQMANRGSFARDLPLKHQIIGAAGSIKDNFAEGFERGGKREFIQFISCSKGSAGEVRSQLDSALDRGHITRAEFDQWDAEADAIGKMLNGLSEYLKRSEHAGLKFKTSGEVNPKPETRNKKPGPIARQGFSLVELLVAMAVLSVMMVLLFGIFDQATDAWRRSEQKIDAFREARAALHYLKRDLEAMVVDANVPWVFFADPRQVPDAPPPAGYGPVRAAAPPAANGDTLFFISRQPMEAQESGSLSDLCAVGYYLNYTNNPGVGAPAQSYKLYRYFHSSNPTWVSGASGLQPFLVQRSASANLTAAQVLAAGQTLFAAANPVSGDEILARNVINLFIRAYNAAGAEMTAGVNGPLAEKPAFFEISLRALNQDTAAKLNSQADWINNSHPLVVQNQREFRVRVAVP